MDEQFWRYELRVIRREIAHRQEMAEKIEKELAGATRHEPQDTAPKSSRFEVFAALAVGGIGIVGLGILAWWQSL